MSDAASHYDALETREPAVREREQFQALAAQLANAKARAPAFARLLADVDPAAVSDRRALARLPIVRKSELMERQKAGYPFGGLNAAPVGELARIFASPGPIYDPETHRPDYYRLARALYAAGFRKGDLVHNCFAYHFTPAGSMMEAGAHALGCPVIPAGTGQTELQVRVIADLKPAGYAGTPSFLKIILDRAHEMGVDVSSLKRASVSGEALPPTLRADIKGHGVDVRQCYAIADLGLVAYETVPNEGLVIDEGLIVEIVRPGTGDPVAEGEVGEVVVTTFNPDYPLIRFATGDLSAVLPGRSACGRTNQRLKGWLGRADQTTKVRGMFVHPSQLAEVLKRHPEVVKGRLVVDTADGLDRMILHAEVAGGGSDGLKAALVDSLHEVTKLRGGVSFAAPGSLANDGKVIDDQRKYD